MANNIIKLELDTKSDEFTELVVNINNAIADAQEQLIEFDKKITCLSKRMDLVEEFIDGVAKAFSEMDMDIAEEIN